MSDVATTADLTQRVLTRFSRPEWYSIEEATLGNRRADVIAINLYRSRAWAIHGFEVKASRGDWIRELANPDKAEELHRFVDVWWVVAPKGLVESGELPAGWGLLEPSGRGLRAKTQPIIPKKYPNMKRELFARFLLKMLDAEQAARNDAASALADERRESIREEAKRFARQENEDLEYELESIRTKVSEFEEASGVSLDRWRSRRIGEAVKVVLAMTRRDDIAGTINDLSDNAAELASGFSKLLEALDLPKETTE